MNNKKLNIKICEWIKNEIETFDKELRKTRDKQYLIQQYKIRKIKLKQGVIYPKITRYKKRRKHSLMKTFYLKE